MKAKIRAIVGLLIAVFVVSIAVDSSAAKNSKEERDPRYAMRGNMENIQNGIRQQMANNQKDMRAVKNNGGDRNSRYRAYRYRLDKSLAVFWWRELREKLEKAARAQGIKGSVSVAGEMFVGRYRTKREILNDKRPADVQLRELEEEFKKARKIAKGNQEKYLLKKIYEAEEARYISYYWWAGKREITRHQRNFKDAEEVFRRSSIRAKIESLTALLEARGYIIQANFERALLKESDGVYPYCRSGLFPTPRPWASVRLPPP